MPTKTQHDRLVWALQARGYRQVEARTGKYTVLTKEGFTTNGGKPAFYFVGPNGALRVGSRILRLNAQSALQPGP